MIRICTAQGQFAGKTAMAFGWSEETGVYALAQAANALAAEGAACAGMEAQILFPVYADRTKAYGISRRLKKAGSERGIELEEIQIRPSPLWEVPGVLVSGIGEAAACDTDTKKEEAHREAEIVLVKWIGVEGMLRIVDEKEEELRQRFAPIFIRQIQSYRDQIFAGEELKIAREMGVSGIYQIAEGGIWAALWELAKDTGMGMEADMKRISVLQETIEVCERYRLNPYQMTSAGSFLMITEDGNALADALRENRIRASVIGRLTGGRDKVLHNGADIRYLDRPAPDELYKIFDTKYLQGGNKDGRHEKADIKISGEKQQS